MPAAGGRTGLRERAHAQWTGAPAGDAPGDHGRRLLRRLRRAGVQHPGRGGPRPGPVLGPGPAGGVAAAERLSRPVPPALRPLALALRRGPVGRLHLLPRAGDQSGAALLLGDGPALGPGPGDDDPHRPGAGRRRRHPRGRLGRPAGLDPGGADDLGAAVRLGRVPGRGLRLLAGRPARRLADDQRLRLDAARAARPRPRPRRRRLSRPDDPGVDGRRHGPALHPHSTDEGGADEPHRLAPRAPQRAHRAHHRHHALHPVAALQRHRGRGLLRLSRLRHAALHGLAQQRHLHDRGLPR